MVNKFDEIAEEDNFAFSDDSKHKQSAGMEDFDFSPPETGFSHDSGTLNKHMEDFFSDVEPSIFKEEGKDSGSSDPISFGFGAEYDIKPESRPG